MAYGDFNDLPGRTVADKVLRDKAYNIVKNQEYDLCQCGLASLVYKFFDISLLVHMQINLLAVVLKVKLFQTKI